MKDPISTEGRNFAAQVKREIKRRERIGAHKLVGSIIPKFADRYDQFTSVNDANWVHGFLLLSNYFRKQQGPRQRIELMRKVDGWLEAIPLQDRGFSHHLKIDKKRYSTLPRSGALVIMTLEPGPHPMQIMADHNEAGVRVMRHSLTVKPSRDGLSLAEMQAYVSDHALGRLCERWTGPDPITATDGIYFAHYCWKAAWEANARDGLERSGLNFPFCPDGTDEPLYAEGVMRVSPDLDGERVCNWFDVRTTLSHDMLEPAQLAQATALAKSADAGNYDEPIAAVAPRLDFVTKTVAAARAAQVNK